MCACVSQLNFSNNNKLFFLLLVLYHLFVVPQATTEKDEAVENEDEFVDVMPDDADTIEGLLMTSSAARNDADYIKFMALYQVSFGTSNI